LFVAYVFCVLLCAMPGLVLACVFMLTYTGYGVLAGRYDLEDSHLKTDQPGNVMPRIRAILSGNFAEKMQGHIILGVGLTKLWDVGNALLLSDATKEADATPLMQVNKAYYPVMDMSFKEYSGEIWPIHNTFLEVLHDLPYQLLPEGKWVKGTFPFIVHESIALQVGGKEVDDDRGFAHVSFFWEYNEGRGPEYLAVHFDRGTSGHSEMMADFGMYERSAKHDMGLWRSFLYGTAKKAAGYFAKKTPLGKLDVNKQLARESLFDNIRKIVDTISTYDLVNQQKTTHLFFGHSLGGAISAISGMMLKEKGHSKVAVVSTNSPAVMELGHRFNLFKPSTSAVGFINLVHQHDLVWKIDRPLHGQQICMYMQQPDEVGCVGLNNLKQVIGLLPSIQLARNADGVGKQFVERCFPHAHNFGSDALDEDCVQGMHWPIEYMHKMAGKPSEFDNVWICTDKAPRPEQTHLDLEQVVDLSAAFKGDLFVVEGKQFKCCVHSGGAREHIIVDITVGHLSKVRHWCTEKSGCGCMFGDGWHSFRKVEQTGRRCEQTLGYLSAKTGIAPPEILSKWGQNYS